MIEISFHNHHEKFFRDAISYEDDNYLIQTGGVFTTNRREIKESLAKHIVNQYESKGEIFVNDFRGSFRIYLFDKRKDVHLVYTNHAGDKRIYYYAQQGITIVSNSIKRITTLLKENKRTFSLNRDSAYYMLTYAYLYGNRTIVSEIKLLRPGQYLKISNLKTEVIPYHQLHNTPEQKLSLQDSIEQADVLFRQAITREFEVDKEYGFTTLCSLSGGLDSRMCTWVGHEMGYSDMISFTFAQSSSTDRTIAEQIVKKLGHQWIFHKLDDAGFMTALEDVMDLAEGEVSYLNMSHGKYAVDQLDFSEYGVLHTGQLGDVIMGSFCKTNEYGKPKYVPAISNHLIPKLPVEELNQYDNLELMLFQNRGFNSALSGNLSIQPYSEVTSPFIDVDYFDFCLSIPLEFRIHHRIYKEWILQKYPGAAAFKWDKLGRKITEKTVVIRGKPISVSKLPEFFVQGLKYHANRIGNFNKGENLGMNPFQYWYNTNEAVHQFIDTYYQEHIDLLSDHEIRQDSIKLFTTGSIYQKAQVISLLALIKRFWS